LTHTQSAKIPLNHKGILRRLLSLNAERVWVQAQGVVSAECASISRVWRAVVCGHGVFSIADQGQNGGFCGILGFLHKGIQDHFKELEKPYHRDSQAVAIRSRGEVMNHFFTMLVIKRLRVM
jgi:hypothetical protein